MAVPGALTLQGVSSLGNISVGSRHAALSLQPPTSGAWDGK